MRTWIHDKENRLVSFDYSSMIGETRDDSKTLRELFSPITTNPSSCMVLPVRDRTPDPLFLGCFGAKPM